MSYLTNGKVAWQIPNRIDTLYEAGVYSAFAGWFILMELPPKARQGNCGEWRIPQGAKALEGINLLATALKMLHKKRKRNILDQADNILRKKQSKRRVNG